MPGRHSPITYGDLYYGSSGVILFYLELYQQTGDAAFLRQADEGAAYLIAAVPEVLYFEKGLNALDLFPSLNRPAEGGFPVCTAPCRCQKPVKSTSYRIMTKPRTAQPSLFNQEEPGWALLPGETSQNLLLSPGELFSPCLGYHLGLVSGQVGAHFREFHLSRCRLVVLR